MPVEIIGWIAPRVSSEIIPEYRKIKRPFPPTTAPTPCWGRPAHPAPHALAVAGRPPVRAAGHRQDGWLGMGCRHGWSCSGGGRSEWRLLLRFERIQQRHYGMKVMAYTLINLRGFCGV